MLEDALSGLRVRLATSTPESAAHLSCLAVAIDSPAWDPFEQGPLDECRGYEWTVFARVRLASGETRWTMASGDEHGAKLADDCPRAMLVAPRSEIEDIAVHLRATLTLRWRRGEAASVAFEGTFRDELTAVADDHVAHAASSPEWSLAPQALTYRSARFDRLDVSIRDHVVACLPGMGLLERTALGAAVPRYCLHGATGTIELERLEVALRELGATDGYSVRAHVGGPRGRVAIVFPARTRASGAATCNIAAILQLPECRVLWSSEREVSPEGVFDATGQFYASTMGGHGFVVDVDRSEVVDGWRSPFPSSSNATHLDPQELTILDRGSLSGTGRSGATIRTSLPIDVPRDTPEAYHPVPDVAAWLLMEPVPRLRCFNHRWGAREIALPSDVEREKIAVVADGRVIVPGESRTWIVTPEDGSVLGLEPAAYLGDRVHVTEDEHGLLLWTMASGCFRIELPRRGA